MAHFFKKKDIEAFQLQGKRPELGCAIICLIGKVLLCPTRTYGSKKIDAEIIPNFFTLSLVSLLIRTKLPVVSLYASLYTRPTYHS